MSRHFVRLEVEVTIVTTDEGEAGIDRYVRLSPELAAVTYSTPGMSKDDVLQVLATQCVYGYTDANQDGWADLDRDSIQMHISDVQECI